MFDLTGRTALVTGAGQGMGLGIAKALAGAGASVFVNDIHDARAKQGAAETGGTALTGDITKAATLKGFKDKIGALDILVNNAGVPDGMVTSLAQAGDLSEESYKGQMELNHIAVRKLCDLFVPDMRARGHGRVLVISSESHRLGLSIGLSHYTAAKAATLGYMRALAAEVGRDGVTINALSLGTMNNFEGHERAAISTLIGRAGTPQDVGAAALFLCSNEASWMTGQTIALNGGACTA